MSYPDAMLVGVAGAAAAGWAVVGAVRVRDHRPELALRGLLGGGAAFGVAFSAYELLEAAGLGLRWERLLEGGWSAAGAALVIGLIEEGAKLAGIALAVRETARRRAVMAVTLGVCAGFAALESVTALSGVPAGPALTRALLAPVAHALLAVPLGFSVALAAQRGWRAGLLIVPAALAVAALLHGAGDLALTVPRYGRLGFATALAAPMLALFLHDRRFALQATHAQVPRDAAERR